MDLVRHENWIAGSWSPASTGLEFEPRGARDAAERWPRSGAAEVGHAIAAARAAARDWSAAGVCERRERLERALEQLAPPRPVPRSPDEPRARTPRDPLAALLGLRSRELAPHREAALAAAREELERGAETLAGAPRGPRIVLVRARAAELFHGLLERAFPPLAAGDCVILLSDPGLPELADELARALERAELPPGAVALLHDDGATVLRAAVARPELGALRWAGWKEELDVLHAEVGRLRAAVAVRAAEPDFGGAPAPFGAGIERLEAPDRHTPELALELRAVCNKSGVVRSTDDVLERAVELARAAFGRPEALGGQLAGQVGRVLCHEAVFSRFTAALLDEVDRLSPIGAGAPLLDPELGSYVEGVRRLGLDEGATLVRGLDEAPAGSRRNGAAATLCASVFTNAEPRMRLARASRPAPVLTLLRAADDAAAAALAAELPAGGAARLDGAG